MVLPTIKALEMRIESKSQACAPQAARLQDSFGVEEEEERLEPQVKMCIDVIKAMPTIVRIGSWKGICPASGSCQRPKGG